MNSLLKRKAVAILTVTAIGMQNVSLISAAQMQDKSAKIQNQAPFQSEESTTTGSAIEIQKPTPVTTGPAIGVQDPNNLLDNAGFEVVEVGTEWVNQEKPIGWEIASFANNTLPSFEMIERAPGNKAVVINITQDKSRAELKQTNIKVNPNTDYTLTVDANINITNSGNFGIQIKQYDSKGKFLRGDRYLVTQKTNGWETLTHTFGTLNETAKIDVSIMAGASNFINRGTIQVDQMSLLEGNSERVQSISLNTSQIKGKVGMTQQLSASVAPANASNKHVTFVSGDETVAKVDSNGKVELLGVGQTTITATTNDGQFTATCQVIVQGEDVAEVGIKNGDFTEVQTVTGDPIWTKGEAPAYWSAKEWSPYVVPEMGIVDVAGRENVLEMKIGKANSRITVLQKVEVASSTNYKLSFDANIAGVEGNEFGIQIKQYNAQNKELSDIRKTICRTKDTKGWNELSEIIYTDKDTVAIEVVIMAGAAAPLSAGLIQVDNFNLQEVHVGVQGVTLDRTSIYDQVGSRHALVSTIKPSTATNQNLSWSSSDDSVATVDQAGQVTLAQPGKAVITATSEDGGHTATCEVTVVDQVKIDQITMTEFVELEMGSSVKLVPTIEPAGVPLEFVEWTSTEESIATVADGKVTPIAPGEAEIIASNQAGTVEARCVIKVVEAMPNYVPNGGLEIVDPKNNKLPQGYTYWTPTGAVRAALDTEAYRGDYSFKIIAEETARTSINTPKIPLTEGTYRISVWTKTENVNASQGVRFRYNLKKSDGGTITNYSSGKKTTDGWEQISLIVQAPAGTQEIDVQTFFEVGTGTVWIDEIRIEEWTMLESIQLPQEVSIDLSSGDIAQTLIPTFFPANASQKDLVWLSSNSKVASVVDGKVQGKRAGEAIITAMTPDGKIKASTKVVVTGELPPHLVVPVQKIEFANSQEIVAQGTTIKLEPTIAPIDATYTDLTWTSSQPEVAQVVGGRVTGLSEGTAIITATSEDGKVSSTCEVTVTPEERNTFDDLRDKWQARQIGETLNLQDADIKAFVQNKEAVAQKIWESMDKNEERIYLWEEAPDYSKSGDIKESIRRLREMAVAATLEGSSLKGNPELIVDIVEGTLWMYENAYSEAHLGKYNWWDWEIGIPGSLNDIFVLMYEYFTPAEVEAVMGFVQNTIMPDPQYSGNAQQDWREATGANLIDQIKVALIPAVLLEDADKIAQATSYIGSTLAYVTSEDGFYEDGSFIQHTSVAYTGTYGAVLLDGISTLMEFLAGTEYDISQEIDEIFEIVNKAFIPLIYKGGVMDMVRGRAIGRPNSDSMGNGRGIVNSIMKIGYSAPEPYRTKFLELCKGWTMQARALYKYPPIGNPYAITLTNQLLADDTLEAISMPNMSHEYVMMNRRVHHADNFTAGISKSSKRVKTYELTNGENQKGWHTGDGMLYLYNNDLGQFDDAFWATVNYKRLPGTTVDTKPRTWGDMQNGDGEKTPTNEWAGGSTLGAYGASGMNVKLVGSDMVANKSWFLFDDEIIALGSDINSQEAYAVETIVEQRKINGDNQLTVDGQVMPTDLGWESQLTDVTWAHLAGNVEGADIGYYFPSQTTLQAVRQVQSGTNHEISLNGDHTVKSRNFLTMAIDHGKQPTGASYAYALLPGKTAEEVGAYTAEPHFEILANTDTVHAVREKQLGILAANFFADEVATVDTLTVSGPASMLVERGNGYLEVAVSDPTLSNEGTLEITLAEEVKGILTQSPQIEVVSQPEGVKLIVGKSEAKGQTFTIRFETEKDDDNGNGGDDNNGGGNGNGGDDNNGDGNGNGGDDNNGDGNGNGGDDNNGGGNGNGGDDNNGGGDGNGGEDDSDNESNNNTSSSSQDKKPSDEVIETGKIDTNKLAIAELPKGNAEALTDLPKHWAKESIAQVVEAGIMVGKTDKTFAPNDTLTRAELAVMLNRMLKVEGDVKEAEFKDIKGDEWYAEAVQNMNTLGIMTGYKAGSFGPKQAITRTEVMVLMTRMMQYLGVETQVANPEVILGNYQDGESISSWAVSEVAWCINSGLIEGDQIGNLKGKQSITRAEIATVMQRVLEVVKEKN